MHTCALYISCFVFISFSSLLSCVFFFFSCSLPCCISLNGISILPQVCVVAHHCLGSQCSEEQKRVMSPYITSPCLLFPAALFLAKAVWGAITTTHKKSDCLNHSWKNNFSTLIRVKRVPLSKGISEMGSLMQNLKEQRSRSSSEE